MLQLDLKYLLLHILQTGCHERLDQVPLTGLVQPRLVDNARVQLAGHLPGQAQGRSPTVIVPDAGLSTSQTPMKLRDRSSALHQETEGGSSGVGVNSWWRIQAQIERELERTSYSSSRSM